MTDNAALKALADNGVSVWLDDLSRDRIETGNLQELIDTKGVVGVTTNPSIFQAALAKGDRYDADLRQFAADGKTVDETVFGLTTAGRPQRLRHPQAGLRRDRRRRRPGLDRGRPAARPRDRQDGRAGQGARRRRRP